MKCENCEDIVDINSNFCSNCGVEIAGADAIISHDEWNLVSMLEILTEMGDETQIDKDMQVFHFLSIWSFTRPAFGTVTDFHKALNAANQATVISTFTVADDYDSIRTVTFLYVTESITKKDVCRFIEWFGQDIRVGFTQSGLKRWG